MSRFTGVLWLASFGGAGVVFAVVPHDVLIYVIITTVVVQTGHQISPIALAWSHAGFREVMLRDPVKFLLLPAGLFLAAVVCPFAWVFYGYNAWNAYHYGMQNFGVLSLWRRPQRRWLTMGLCLALTTGPMLGMLAWGAPYGRRELVDGWFLVLMAANQFNHWIVDIGLAGRVSQWGWWLVAAVLIGGLIGFVWYEPSVKGFHPRSKELLQIAMGLGFVHFLYSRWDWQRNSPLLTTDLPVAQERESGSRAWRVWC